MQAREFISKVSSSPDKENSRAFQDDQLLEAEDEQFDHFDENKIEDALDIRPYEDFQPMEYQLFEPLQNLSYPTDEFQESIK